MKTAHHFSSLTLKDKTLELFPEPPFDCDLCPRLKEFRDSWRCKEPSWYNGPIPPFTPLKGLETTRLLIIGLAPGLRGANRTGRAFTGDYAGSLLYNTLKKFGLSSGEFKADPKDGLELIETSIVNCVRCVPPENKPLGGEITNCRRFFTGYVKNLPTLQAIVTLGSIAHQSLIRALGEKVADHKFKHHKIETVQSYKIFSTYHCSRYNTNTNRLTTEMFEAVFADVSNFLKENPQIKF